MNPKTPSLDVEDTTPFNDTPQDPLEPKEMDDNLMQEGDDKSTSPIPPGGRSGISGVGGTGDKMQYSAEHGRTYSGSAVVGKVIHPSANSKLNSMYGN